MNCSIFHYCNAKNQEPMRLLARLLNQCGICCYGTSDAGFSMVPAGRDVCDFIVGRFCLATSNNSVIYEELARRMSSLRCMIDEYEGGPHSVLREKDRRNGGSFP